MASWRNRLVVAAVVVLGLTSIASIVVAAHAWRTTRALEIQVKSLEAEVERQIWVEPLTSEITWTQKDLYHHLYGEFEKDSEGNTPDDVVTRLLTAEILRDWTTAYKYMTQVPKEITLEAYMKDMEDYYIDVLDYGIRDYQVRGPDRAIVFLSYRFRYQSTGEEVLQSAKWPVYKDNGVWKVRWMPEQ